MIASVEEAQRHLPDLLERLLPGDEIHLHQKGIFVAKIVLQKRSDEPRKAGSAADTPHWMAPDFDAPLEEFREYME